jgi:hypothetical protein
MALTTPEEVKEIISGCTLTTDQIDPFLLGAHIYLNKVFTGDTTLGTTIRREIERWFTAHMIVSVGFINNASATGAVIRERVGEAEVEYAATAIKAVTGLGTTAYGRMAMQLDTAGLLAKAGKMQASIYAVKSFDNTGE